MNLVMKGLRVIGTLFFDVKHNRFLLWQTMLRKEYAGAFG